MYIKEGMKKKIKKKCTKRGKGWKGGKGSGKLRCVPHSMRAKWSAKTETARCATGSSVGRTQGLPATSAEGSSTTLTPSIFSSWISSNSSKRLTVPPLLSLLFDPFNDRGRGFYKEIIGLVYKWYDCRCNYRDVIISYYLEISVSRISLRFFDIGDYSCVLIFFFLLVFWIYMKVYIEYLELIIFKIFERCFMIVFHNLHHIVYYIF